MWPWLASTFARARTQIWQPFKVRQTAERERVDEPQHWSLWLRCAGRSKATQTKSEAHVNSDGHVNRSKLTSVAKAPTTSTRRVLSFSGLRNLRPMPISGNQVKPATTTWTLLSTWHVVAAGQVLALAVSLQATPDSLQTHAGKYATHELLVFWPSWN